MCIFRFKKRMTKTKEISKRVSDEQSQKQTEEIYT